MGSAQFKITGGLGDAREGDSGLKALGKDGFRAGIWDRVFHFCERVSRLSRGRLRVTMHKHEFPIVNQQENKFTNENFSGRFAILLSDSALSQKHLAATLGLAESAIVNYKNGRIPKAAELYRIARFFNVTIEWLLTGDEPKTPVYAQWNRGFFVAFFSFADGCAPVALSCDEDGLYKLPDQHPPRGIAKFAFFPPDHPAAISREEQILFSQRYADSTDEERRQQLSLGPGTERFFTARDLAAFGITMKRYLIEGGSP